MAQHDRNGNLRCLGNWTLGQILGHLAAWADYSYGQSPIKVTWFLKIIARPMKKRFLNNPMPAGGRLPGMVAGTLATEALSTDQGLENFRRAFTRLKTEDPARRHPIFGKLDHQEWIKLNLRHAELHLSFVGPKP